MLANRQFKTGMYIIAGFLVVFVVLPNTINFRERAAFSPEKRIEWASEEVNVNSGLDSISVIPGEYYRRNRLHSFFFGEKYRELWNTDVKLPIERFSKNNPVFNPIKIGGGQQTVGIDVVDDQGREWAVRSVNKDQSKALPKFLQPTLFRFMIRDQVAALNPYGALVVPTLAEAIGIYHTNPYLAMVAYDTAFGLYNKRMAGRVVLIEEDADGSWKNQEVFDSPEKVIDTEDLAELDQQSLQLDTLLYAKSRLLDLLISDWDRHEGQWSWGIFKTDSGILARPIPVDRDMAFYKFDEGLIPKLMLVFNNKFQSFNPEYGNLKGLGYQARHLDAKILPGVSKQQFIALAESIQEQLPDSVINQAFSVYPDKVYQQIGIRHIEVLKERRKQLATVAGEFYELVIENREKNLKK